jgi:hypothetical protein
MSRDLAAIIGEDTPERATLQLLRRCAIEPDGPSTDSVLESLLEAVEAALEQADPLAHLNLELRCEACGRSWPAPLDIAAFLWEEIEAYSARLLDDVHVLARAYGWSESAILALPEARRAAYLERVTT